MAALALALPAAASGQASTLVWESLFADEATATPVVLGGTTFTISGTDESGIGSPDNFTIEWGERGAHTGFWESDIDPTIQSEHVTFSMTFSQEVDSLTFSLLDIDSNNQFQDSVTVLGWYGGTSFTPSAVAGGTGVAIVAPGVYVGRTSVPNLSPAANVDLTFGQPLDSVTFFYGPGPDAAADPDQQVIGVSDMRWALTAALTGHVFQDTNGNGVQDGGEPNLSGVSVVITDSQAGSHTVVTDAAGDWIVFSLPGGATTVDITDATLPPGSTLTAGTDPTVTTAVVGSTVDVGDVGYQLRGSAAGHVFDDVNANGVQDGVEGDLSGLSVVITDSQGGTTTVTTNASGDWTASGLPVGAASVNVTDPVGGFLTTANDPQVVAVPAGATGTATDVGFQFRGSAAGHVFDDVNANGVQDGVEGDLSGLSVVITDSQGGTTTVTTDGTGDWSASGLPVGAASVNVTDPVGGFLTTANDPQTVTVPAGATGTATDVGFQFRGSAAGHVFDDVNANGVQDGVEGDLSGLSVVITDSQGGTTTVTTDGTGDWTASGLPVGAASVNVTDPVGGFLTTANDPQTVTVPVAGTGTATDVGFQFRGSAAGHVFDDVNANGLQDGVEGDLSGLSVVITDSQGGTTTVTTNGTGDWSASGLPVGAASVNVTDPVGGFLTTANDPQTVTVPAGATGTATDVGFQFRGSAAGHVFDDVNANGLQDGVEGDLSGLSVVITDSQGGTTTVTTDGTGDWTASGLPVGAASVNVTDPVGGFLTTANDPQVVAVPAGATGTATDVGFQFRGSAAGHVFDDVNANGVQDGVEGDLSGLSVVITDSQGGTTTVTTDGTGDWSASGLPVGAASVNVTDPVGGFLTTANDPQTVTVPVAGTGTATDVGFQFRGSAAGHVFDDVNANGVQDGVEGDLSGLSVVITDSQGGTTTVTTDGTGDWSASGLPVGAASVNVTDPVGGFLTTANDPQTVTVPAGATGTATDVGFQFRGSAAGHVFDDVNANGVQDGVEGDLSGLSVVITDSQGGTTTVTTDGTGDWSASGLPVGAASVNVTDPVGGFLTTANDPQTVTVPVAGTGTATDVGFQFRGSAAGHVFDDVNANGVQDGVEGDLSGLSVVITDSQGGTTTVTTDGTGDWSASGLPVGAASVNVTDPVGGFLTTANDPQTVTVPVAGTGTATDVGFQFRGSAAGHVFDDVNANGVQDGVEGDLSGLSVVITDSQGGTTTVTTDGTGDWSASGLPVGAASVNVTDPVGGFLTTANDPQTVTVPVAGTGTATDVGFQFRGSAAGHVFDDVNANGVQDGVEGDLSGLSVVITDSQGGTTTVTTDGTGDWTASGLPVGAASVNVTDPVGGFLTTANDPQTVTVPAGATGTATDVGFQFRGSAAGHVFDDVNGNGVQDGVEGDLSGLSVVITDSQGGTTTVTTDGTGDWTASGLPVGAASVNVTDPVGGFLTTANDPQTVTVPVAGTGTATDVGFQFRGSAAGHVFDDVNANGVQDGVEGDLSGLSVVITDSQGGTTTVTTDGTGDWSASGLPVGAASVNVTDPVGGFLTTANDPQTVTVPVAGTGTATDVGFQFRGSAAGHVFDDVNANGVQDGVEGDLSGLSVVITDSQGGTTTVTTDGTGDWSASGLPVGAASVNVTDPVGGFLTTANDPQTVTVPVAGTGTATDVGFQFRGSAAGHVFDDVNGNGVQDGVEGDLSGLSVVITDSQGGTTTVTTDGTGDWSASGLPVGSASVNVTDPVGGFLTTANDPQTVTVPVAGTGTATDVGFQFRGSAAGHVFDDVNANGVQDGGEPDLAGVSVVITDSQGGTTTVTTDGTGDWSASGLPVGAASVNVTDPVGGFLTTANDPQTVTVPAGATGTATDVGFQFRGSAAGHVFDDVNGNGVQDGVEGDLSGLSVVITDSQGGTTTVTTDGTGDWTTSGLPVGAASVNVTDPVGGFLTTANDPQTVTVPVAGTVTATDVGFQFRGSAAGHVFDDANANGVQDGVEGDLSGLSVVITDSQGGTTTVTTDGTGDWSASGLPVGAASVNVTDPVGGFLTTANDPQTVTVPAGATGTATDVGFQFRGSANGHVFNDVDANGVQDGGEPDLAGVSVVITDSQGGTTTVTTDAIGDWTTSGLPVGAASVNVTDPVGGALTTGNDPQSVTVPVAGTVSATDVGYQLQGSATGHVFDDVNANGVQDGGEPDLSGVSVVITDSQGGTTTVTTDGTGDWSASGLPVGAASVNVTDPVGGFLTTANDPQTVTVPVAGTGTATDVGFQFRGSAAGHVFDDVNGNGVQDGVEGDLSGLSVVITDSQGGTTTVTTDATGDWTASGLPAGAASVDVTDPVGGFLTTANDPQSVTVPAGATGTATDVGFQFQGSANGHVFNDVDANGVQDGGEPDLAGVSVVITDSQGGTTTVTTDAIGDWTTSGLPVGTASVDVTDPVGGALTTGNDPQSVTVPVGGTVSATDVGYQLQGSATGHVFDDVNANGVQDGGEPDLSGVSVVITDSQSGTTTVTTNATGDWTASGLPTGVASVSVTDPVGGVLTTSNDPQSVTVPVAGTGTATDVGFQFQGGASGHVFDDVNGNGVQDGGEGDLAGLSVVITDSQGGTTTVTTNASGDWTASGLPVGAASVNVTDPVSGVLTTANDPQSVTVPVTGTGIATDVGFQFQGSATGHVFDDVNGNGLQDGGEADLAGLSGVITDSQGGTTTVTTDASGDWTANNLPVGAASVNVTDPVGGVLTTGNDPQSVTVPVAGTGTATDVGFQFQGSATGHVFDDVNGNGVQDGGEADLAGLSVVITDSQGGTTTVTTDAIGDWTTSGLPVGTASVNVTDPVGGALTTGNDPQSVTVPAGGTVSTTDVGYQLQGSATGHVFDDVNANGVQDGGEPDLSGVSVVITDSQSGTTTVTTNATGDWTASGLPTGVASVSVTDPVGGVLTTSNDPQTVTVPVAGTGTATDVGFQFQGSATGHVFDDVNASGVQDGGEADLAGLSVVITDSQGGTTTVTTDASGDWSAGGLPVGAASVSVTDPVGGVLTTANDPQSVTVPVAGTGTATDVGFQFQGSATGHVFDDVNGNGVQDGGEADLAGLSVVITDSQGGTTTVTTDASGDWTASGLPAGAASVNVTDPVGGVSTTGNDPQSVTVPVAGTGATTDVGFQFQGSASGHMFDDLNANGAQDGGEPDLTGVSVVITDSQGGTTTVTTNASGDWTASGLPVGAASVDVTDPVGGVLTTGNDPQSVTVPVAGTATATDVGFQLQGSATGHVFDDVNANGVQDGGEADLVGLSVMITDSQGGTTTVTTDASGNWSASGLPVGAASVNVTDPVGGMLTTGNDPQSVTVPGAGTGTATDVGFQFQGSASGHVFDDVNANGVQDGGEPDLSGVSVVITDSQGGTTTVTTDASGDWTASGLPVGAASVNVTDPVGGLLTTGNDPQSLTVPVAGTGTATDVGYQLQGSATGHVFDDLNGNGVQDGGEPDLAGLSVVIADSQGGTTTVTTDASGDWTASGLPTGVASVNVTDPVGGVLTTSNDPQSVTVPVAGTSTATDVGFQFQGSATGHVFDDVNANGVQDGGEADLAGLSVVITDSQGGTTTVTTDASGNWSASGLPVGSASVNVTDPVGGALTTGNDPQSATVPVAGTGTTTDVGFQFQGSANGHMFDDVDGNGVQDGGEPDLAGVTVVITDSQGGTTTVTTDAIGDWTTGGLPVGTASVDVTDPVGGALTTGNDPQSVTVPAGGTVSTTDVGYQLQGSATGHVFDDVNANGVQDGGEPDLAGLSVVITDSQGGTTTVTTDASGDWTASGLPTGAASVDVTDPVGGVLTTGNDPQSVTVPVAGSVAAADVGFQFRGSAAGHVFDDVNGNGVQDGGEAGLSGVGVVITDSQSGTTTVTTNATGDWTASGLPTGVASVDVTDPTGGVLTTGNDPQSVTVPAGGTVSPTDVGYQLQGSATGHVFDDVNANGVQDGGEPDLAGLSVVITDSQGGTTTVTTDASGDWTTSGLPVGAASVDVTDPVGGVLTTGNDPQSVTVPVAGSVAAADVGFQFRGSAAGHVFDDANGNGVQDGGESDLAGLSVVITDSQGGTTTVTTDATGDWSTSGLPVGAASVDVTDPVGGVLTTGNDPQSGNVPAGGTVTATDVGYQFRGSASGHVFDDVNANGVQDGGEPDLAGLSVVITDSQGGTTTVTTNASGDWTASGLPVNAASVDVTDPVGGVLTTGNDPQSVTVPVAGTVAATDVGFQLQGSLSGHLFDDLNGNGVQDGGEPDLSGVSVVITDSQGGTTAVTTNATGDWTASGLPTGVGSVDVTDPTGGVLTTGNDPQSVTVPVAGTGTATAVGFQFQGSATGRVFDDENANGVQDGSEAGLSAVAVVITDSQGGTTTVTTDASGDWTASGLPVGAASVNVTDPFGGVLTTANDPQGVNVPAGGTVTATDVGYQLQGSATGHLFDDVNGNGVQDGGEPDLSGVSVVITNSQGGTTTVTTNAAGDWTASGLPAGTATVDVTDPAPGVLTTGNDPQSMTVPVAGSVSATAVGFQFQGAVAGRLFDDVNGNGVQDGGEAGLAGVDVVITDSQGGSTTVITDANGDWTASGLPMGTATVDVDDSTLPAGSTLTGGVDPQTVDVTAGGTTAAASAGYQLQGTLTGHAFEDTNGNGVQDGGESGFAGATVLITDSQGGTTTVTTDVNGDWTAPGLPAGAATVDVTDPAGGILTTANDPQSVTVPAAGTATATDIGFQLQGTVSGHLFDDQNANGVQDSGEPDLSGVDVVITDSQGGTQTVTTDANGDYSAPVPAGSTTIDVVDPNGFVLTTGNDPQTVNVPVDGTGVAADVGFQGQGTVTGHVFEDPNGNGVQDAGEPDLTGVDVVITDSQGGTTTVTTDAGGNWTVSGLPAGAATVDVDDATLPAGATLTTGNDGQSVTVPAGGSVAATPIGYEPATTGTVSGHLFSDMNGNGVQDAGEPDLEGVSVTIVDSQGDTTIVSTDANGDFSAIVLGGTATVSVTAPDGSTLTTANGTQTVDVPIAGSVTIVTMGFQPGLPSLSVNKTSARPDVEVADALDYSVAVSNEGTAIAIGVMVNDQLPPGFRYVPGSARSQGSTIADPAGSPGPSVTFDLGDIPAGETRTVTYRLSVGAGALLGDGVNRAYAFNAAGAQSAVSEAEVEVRPGAFSDEGMIIGKIYVECDDCSPSAPGPVQLGIPGVRIYLQDGTSVVSDSEGQYHFFGLSPRLWVARVDPTTLPESAVLKPLTNRHAGDGNSVFVDLKKGELHRADFADGSEDSRVLQSIEDRRAMADEAPQMLDPTSPVAVRSTVDLEIGVGPNSFDPRASDDDQGDLRRDTDFMRGPWTERPGLTLVVPEGRLRADGTLIVPVEVVVDGSTQTDSLTVTLETSRGRWLVTDTDERQPGVQTVLRGGSGTFELQAPETPGPSRVRVSTDGGGADEESVAWMPSVRPLFLTGLLEARLDLRSVMEGDLALGGRDRFEDELRSFSADDGETVYAGARAAAFAKGSVGNDTELTLRLDSEADDRARLFRDIRPEEFYPIYGDESSPLFDAQSKGRFYARLQRDFSYLQYGDFNTSLRAYSLPGAYELGRYNRTLNGALGHVETDRVALNAFASRDEFSQIVDEIPAQGISGPYALSRVDGLVNSERIEIITRDRNQPALVLKAEPMQRFLDYRIEPFSGRVIFMRPIPSIDENLNPVVIRVTYEIESGAEKFWVYGFDGQFKPTSRFEIGGGLVQDDNPLGSFDLSSVNATIELGGGTYLSGELAHADSAGVTDGDAYRLELRHGSSRVSARAFYLNTGQGFANPSAQFLRGRREAGLSGRAKIGEKVGLFGEAIRTEDLARGGTREGAQVGLDYAFRDWLRAELGARVASESTDPASAATVGVTPIKVRSIRTKVTGVVPGTPAVSLFAEYEQDVVTTSQRRAAVGGDYRLFERTKIYARHEFLSSLAGPYALNPGQRQNNTVFGVASDFLGGQSVFSEYRVRDAISGREAQAAIGLRNLWNIREGLRLHSSLERVAPVSGAGMDATAVTASVEYTASPLWRGSARAEFRSAADGDNLFGSLGYARKLSRDWSLLGNTSFSVLTDGERAFERSRLGMAYRQADSNKVSGLARYEHRYDRTPDLAGDDAKRSAHIVTGHVNVQPSLPLMITGQWASKWASESSAGIETSDDAHLAGLRVRRDLTGRLDMGLQGRSLMSTGFASVQWGLGAELGYLIADNLRVSGGYNAFGFRDRELSIEDQTDQGVYVQIGFKFDESLFSRPPR